MNNKRWPVASIFEAAVHQYLGSVLMFNYSDSDDGSRDARASEIKPEFFRLPKSGVRDPFFGLPRTTYYELEKAGTIRLVRLRKRGNVRGTTLIPFDQVLAHLRRLATEVGK